MSSPLPEFIPPMLAHSENEPFDSEEHLFEIKWDGFRAVAFLEAGGQRMMSRNRNDLFPRYPELDFTSDLPPGTVLDGEIVLLVDGKPDFYGLLEREQVRGDVRVRSAARQRPTAYVAFDLLYRDGESWMDRPLVERREALQALVEPVENPRLVFSDGIVGQGVHFFEQARALELEGMVAKRLASPYQPGRRTESWIKIKEVRELQCAILGWIPDETGDLRSLIIASQVEGELRCVGRVGSGLTDAMRARLMDLVRAQARDESWLACEIEGNWIEPGLYCSVSYLEFTKAGTLRAPVFRELIVDTE